MIKTSIETKVGILFFITLIILGIFVYLLGAFNPFTPKYKINVLFNYAGGLSIGSPVRVAGVKVGRVSDINFISHSDTNDLKILVTLLIRKSVLESIKKDSEYFINMSGLIGEKYVEIKPGSSPKVLDTQSSVIGVDPPRIDELISQSHELFSKIETLIKNNKGNLTRILEIAENLTGSINNIVKSTTPNDSKNLRAIISNVQKITSDLTMITEKTKSSIVPILVNLNPTVENLKEASNNLKTFSSFIATLNQKDKKDFEAAVKNISLITKNLSDLTAKMDKLLKDFPDLNMDEFKEIFSKTGVKVKLF